MSLSLEGNYTFGQNLLKFIKNGPFRLNPEFSTTLDTQCVCLKTTANCLNTSNQYEARIGEILLPAFQLRQSTHIHLATTAE
jgi:hypothetical protein